MMFKKGLLTKISLCVVVIFLIIGCGPNYHFKKADKLLSQQKLQEAIDAYRKIVKKYPESKFAANSQFKIANIYFYRLKDYKKAVKEYNYFITKFPKDKNAVSAQYQIGLIYFKHLRDYPSAKKEFKKIINNYPKEKDWITKAEKQIQDIASLQKHLSLGKGYFKNNKFKNAVKSFEVVLKIDPNHPEAKSKFKEAWLNEPIKVKTGKVIRCEECDKITRKRIRTLWVKRKDKDKYIVEEIKKRLCRRCTIKAEAFELYDHYLDVVWPKIWELHKERADSYLRYGYTDEDLTREIEKYGNYRISWRITVSEKEPFFYPDTSDEIFAYTITGCLYGDCSREVSIPITRYKGESIGRAFRYDTPGIIGFTDDDTSYLEPEPLFNKAKRISLNDEILVKGEITMGGLGKRIIVIKPTEIKILTKPEPEVKHKIIVEPDSEKEVIKNIIYSWKDAWESRDIERYMNFYSQSFQGKAVGRIRRPFDYHGWKEHKRRLFERYTYIRISIEEPTIIISGENARASFYQEFTSNEYSDAGKKILVFRKENGEWKIINEDFLKY